MQPERSEPKGRIADKIKIAVHWKNILCKLCVAHILCVSIPQSCKNKSGGKGGKGKRLAWRAILVVILHNIVIGTGGVERWRDYNTYYVTPPTEDSTPNMQE